MNPETILNAMLTVHREMLFEFGKYASAQEIKESKRYRQLHAFRARIIRMDAEKDRQIAIREEDKWNLKDEIAYYKGTLAKKDARIAELEEEVESLELRIWNIAFDLKHGG